VFVTKVTLVTFGGGFSAIVVNILTGEYLKEEETNKRKNVLALF